LRCSRCPNLNEANSPRRGAPPPKASHKPLNFRSLLTCNLAFGELGPNLACFTSTGVAEADVFDVLCFPACPTGLEMEPRPYVVLTEENLEANSRSLDVIHANRAQLPFAAQTYRTGYLLNPRRLNHMFNLRVGSTILIPASPESPRRFNRFLKPCAGSTTLSTPALAQPPP
jgi:hypothetical protein